MSKKSCILFVIVGILISTLCSCKADTVELIESTTAILKKETERKFVSKEVIETQTIDFDKIINESVESAEESTKEESSSALETSESTIQETSEITETSETSIFDKVVEKDDRVYHGTEKVETEGWKYGMTPCEWVYIEPEIQLISNYKPNSSNLYSANGKVRTSSGLKGCFVPIFCKTDMMSNDYDGRIYIFSDYSKSSPENMLFDNSLRTVKYRGVSVEEILKMGLAVERAANGVLKVGNEYINIIYATDLDKILNGR